MELKRQWENWNWDTDPEHNTDLSSTRICLDGDLGTILKTYREVGLIVAVRVLLCHDNFREKISITAPHKLSFVPYIYSYDC